MHWRGGNKAATRQPSETGGWCGAGLHVSDSAATANRREKGEKLTRAQFRNQIWQRCYKSHFLAAKYVINNVTGILD